MQRNKETKIENRKEHIIKETENNQIDIILRIIRSIIVLVMIKKKRLQTNLNPYQKVISLRIAKVFGVITHVE